MFLLFKRTMLVGLVTLFLGCDKLPSASVANTNFLLVNTEKLFQVAVPDYMSKATNLSEEASLQYQNLLKELYLVVLHEPADEFQEAFQNIGMYEDSISLLDNYTNVQYESITDEMEIASDVVRKSAKINGLPARIIAFDADLEGVDVPITYYYTIYQGSKNVYLMLSWTLKSRRTTYLPIMEKMSKSFRLMTDIQ